MKNRTLAACFFSGAIAASSILYLNSQTPARFYRPAGQVSETSLASKKLLPTEIRDHIWAGYQAWFSAGPLDKYGAGNWFHYSRDNRLPPSTKNLNVDVWPFTLIYNPEALVDTGMRRPNGKPLYALSSGHPLVIEKHLELMASAGIQGPFVQRFLSDIRDPKLKKIRNDILARVASASQRTQRVFCVMYDLSGVSNEEVKRILPLDIDELERLRTFSHAQYMTYQSKPLISLWGLGFSDRDLDPDLILQLIDGLHNRGMAVMGGVPFYFHQGGGDMNVNLGWQKVFSVLDVVSPWSVGRYRTEQDFTRRLPKLDQDRSFVESRGQLFLPVVFPGFSWKNLSQGRDPSNDIPRAGGRFLRAQLDGYALLKIKSFYIAMFDEVDEGTAVMPLEPVTAELPLASNLIGLDVDGQKLAPDYYLRLIKEYLAPTLAK